MTDWEQLLANPDYTTDTGDMEKGEIFSKGSKRLGDQSGPNAISLEEAFIKIGQLPGKPMLLVKTIKWGNKPGGFYAKAFASNLADWDDLKELLNNNQALGLNHKRKSWVCGPGRCWSSTR